MIFKNLFKSKKTKEAILPEPKKEDAIQKAAPDNTNDKATTAPKS